MYLIYMNKSNECEFKGDINVYQEELNNYKADFKVLIGNEKEFLSQEKTKESEAKFKKDFNKILEKMDKLSDNIIKNQYIVSKCISPQLGVNPIQHESKTSLEKRKEYLDGLVNGTNVRFDDHKFIYNNNIFKMIYLLTGMGYMGFLIFKSIK